MKNIFIGMLFIFLNLNLDINTLRIGLIPTFIGYILMIKGLSELKGFSNKFSKIIPYAIGMAIFSGISYVMDLLGISLALGTPVNLILGIISSVFSLYISYSIIMGIKDIEVTMVQDLNSKQLYSTWKLLVIFMLLMYLFIIIPILSLISIILNTIMGIYYLCIFYKTQKLFYQQN